ncbi:hypothetical protein EGT74_15935 [Chitinophaga lutea]|uniref:WG repeat-containing protein n=1 Tax=Chitinophaga lutea TaxID=2488634 RepID=A0A3N4PXX9_9BACT|nr:WG repeat-containing protein [Chitinophaga lutea]RPE08530.1 hypothetical protein EGT74_15935 [Chitinophaga lutea]
MKRFSLFSFLLIPMTVAAQQDNSGTVFVNGYARITQGAQSWYMDTLGNKAFDAATPLTGNNAGKQLVQKGARYGITGRRGEWLLQAEYDTIDIQWGDIWKVSKDGRQSWADSTGKLLLPLSFQEAGYLDGRYFDVKQNGRWGIYDSESEQFAIPAEYEGFDYCGGCGRKGDYVLAKKNGKWGVIGFNRQQLAPFVYDHDHYRMRSDEWVTAFTRNKKNVVLHLGTGKEYPAGEVLGNGMMVYRGDQKGMGMINGAGVEVLPPVYEDIASPDPDFAAVTGYVSIQRNGRWGLADTTGRILIQPTYTEFFTTVFDSLFRTQKDGLDVLLSATGKSQLPQGCTDLRILRDAGAAAFRKNGRYGVYYAATGRVVPPAYEEVNEVFYGSDWLKSCLKVVKDGWNGLLDPDGREIVPPQFDEEFTGLAGNDGARLVVVRKGSLYGLFNGAGRRVTPAEYHSISRGPANTALLRVSKESDDDIRYGIIDTAGAVVLPVAYDDMRVISDSLLLLGKGDQRAVMNIFTKNIFSLPDTASVIIVDAHTLQIGQTEGNYLYDLRTRSAITPVYGYIGGFDGGAALVTKNHKAGMIGAGGKVLLPLEYDFAVDLQHGLCLLGKGDKYGVADSTGKLIVPLQYDYSGSAYDIDYQRGRYLLLRRNNAEGEVRLGVADLRGRVLLEPVYDNVLFDEAGQGFIVSQNRRFGMALADGRLAVPCEYDDIVPASINRYAGTFTFSWPLLCKKDGTFEYIRANGQPLPVKVTTIGDTGAYAW